MLQRPSHRESCLIQYQAPFPTQKLSPLSDRPIATLTRYRNILPAFPLWFADAVFSPSPTSNVWRPQHLVRRRWNARRDKKRDSILHESENSSIESEPIIIMHDAHRRGSVICSGSFQAATSPLSRCLAGLFLVLSEIPRRLCPYTARPKRTI